MGIAAWLGLEPKDMIALAVCNVLGFLAGLLIPDPTWALYVSILLAYHLFLGWLVISGEREGGLSMPIFPTVLTHLACAFLIVAIGLGRHHIPFFSIARYGIVAIAIFERKWLFTPAISYATDKKEISIDLLPPEPKPVQTEAFSSLTNVPSQVAPPAYRPEPVAAAPAQPQAVAAFRPEPVPAGPQPRSAPAYRPERAAAPQLVAAPAYAMTYQSLAPQQSSVAVYRPESAPAPQPQAAAAPPPQTQASAVPAQAAPTPSAPTGKRTKGKAAAAPAVNPIMTATGEDHEEWLRHLQRRNPTHRKAGSSIAEEYHDWLAARAKARAAAEAAGARHA
jgi:hypothetical protein